MQKLNWREYYVVVIVGIISIVLLVTFGTELTSDYSSFRGNPDGSVSADKRDLVNVLINLAHFLVAITAFVLLLRKRYMGWILAVALITEVTALSGYLLFVYSAIGVIEFRASIIFPIGLWLLFVLSIVFLFFPSTLRKFNVGRKAVIPVIVVLGILTSSYFVFG